jgi:xanthine dehydrogenase/oxidase
MIQNDDLQNSGSQTLLELVDGSCSKELCSGSASLNRGPRIGRQSYVKDSSTNSILYKGIPKLETVLQCSGEAEYTDDIQHVDGELVGAFVLSSVANATLDNVDASAALVRQFLCLYGF